MKRKLLIGFATLAMAALAALNMNFNIRIYPNPTQGRFAVEINNVPDHASGQIHLLNSQGRLLEKKNIRSERKIDFDLSRELPGVYILNVQLGETISTWKIIKH